MSEKITTEYVGRHRRPHDQLSPLLKRHLDAQRQLETERRRAAALRGRFADQDAVARAIEAGADPVDVLSDYA